LGGKIVRKKSICHIICLTTVQLTISKLQIVKFLSEWITTENRGELRNLDNLLGKNFVLYYLSFYLSSNDKNDHNKKKKRNNNINNWQVMYN
jgi:hypothetical protein